LQHQVDGVDFVRLEDRILFSASPLVEAVLPADGDVSDLPDGSHDVHGEFSEFSGADSHLLNDDLGALTDALPASDASLPEGEVIGLPGDVEFSGNRSDFVEIRHSEALALNNGTVALNFVADDVHGQQALFSKDFGGYNAGDLTAFVIDGRLQVRLQSDQGEAWLSTPVGSIVAGREYHVAVAFGEQGFQLYLNGELAQLRSDVAFGLAENDNNLIVGATNWAQSSAHPHVTYHHFEGTISDFTLFDSQLGYRNIHELTGVEPDGPPGAPTMIDGVLHGTDEGETLDAGANGSRQINGGYGDDHLLGSAEDDVLDGGYGEDRLEGGDGNDLLISRSDGRETIIAQNHSAADDPNHEIDPVSRTYYADQPIVADDVLIGGAGADTFRFELLMNAKPEKILDHAMDNGMIHWHGVAGENAYVHDHWVERLGNEVIWDFNRAEGDKIEIFGHTADAYEVEYLDLNDDGLFDASVIHLQSNQGGSGAHNKDQLGSITVFGDLITGADFSVDSKPAIGVIDHIRDLDQAIAPRHGDPVSAGDAPPATPTIAEGSLPSGGVIGIPSSLQFSGPGSEPVEIHHSEALALNNGTFAFSFVAETTEGYYGLVSKDHADQNAGDLTVYLRDGQLHVRLQLEGDESWLRTPIDSIEAGQEYHVAVSFGEEGFQLYLDGNLQASRHYITQGLQDNPHNLIVGGTNCIRDEARPFHTFRHFQGSIGDFAVYDQQLKLEQIANLTSSKAAGKSHATDDDHDVVESPSHENTLAPPVQEEDGVAPVQEDHIDAPVQDGAGEEPTQDDVLGPPVQEEPVDPPTFNILDFGALADGQTDSRAAIVAALNAAEASGGPAEVYLPEGTFEVSSAIRHTFRSDLRIFGPGTLIVDDTISLLSDNGSLATLEDFTIAPSSTKVKIALEVMASGEVASDQIGSDAMVGDESFSVLDETGFEAGDIVWIVSDELWPHDPANENVDPLKGELQRITDVSSNVLTTALPLWESYDVADGIGAGQETVTVRGITPIRVNIDGVSIDYGADEWTTDNNIGLRIGMAADSKISNLYTRGCAHTGLAIARSFNVTVEDSNWVDSNDANHRLGYGAQVGTSTAVHFYDNNSSNTRHGIDFISGDAPTHGSSVTGGVLIGQPYWGSPISTHAGASHITFTGVTAVGGGNGAIIRSPNTIVQDCIFVQPTENAIKIYGGAGAQILDNSMSLEAYGDYVAPQGYGDTFLQIKEPDDSLIFDTAPNATDQLVVVGNVATSTESFIESYDSTNGTWRRVLIENNVANLQNVREDANTAFIDFQDDDMTLIDTVILDNTANDVSGDFQPFRSADPIVIWGNTVIEGNHGDLSSLSFPTITSPSSASAAENQTFAQDVSAVDEDGDGEGSGLTYSVTGGADELLFAIDAATGVLTFQTAPNYEVPGSADGDNDYEVEVTVVDSGGLTAVQSIIITVTDENDAIYVSVIDLQTRNRGAHLDGQIVVNVLNDLDGDGADAGDPAAADVWVEALVTGPGGLETTVSGFTDASGEFRSDWLRDISSGDYTVDVIDLAHAMFDWNMLLNLHDDADDDGWPDEMFNVA